MHNTISTTAADRHDEYSHDGAMSTISSGSSNTLDLEHWGLNHRIVGSITIDTVTGQLSSTPSDAGYVQFGHGDDVVVATSIIDAIELHSLGIGSRTISPINPEQLTEICVSLHLHFPDYRFLLLGCAEHAPYIKVTKGEVGCSSDYPAPRYRTWAEFLSVEGTDEVKAYIYRNDQEAIELDGFFVKYDHVSGIENQRFIFENLIINQHIVVICSKPNAGKTTIMNWVCSQISELTDVRYLNMDCSGAELKEYQVFAQDNGFHFINFDITSTVEADFFQALHTTSDLRGKLYVIDTLKKVVDPMNKGSMKAFMKGLRTLCVKGATFVLLSHTNKHTGPDGLPVFEGVGDLRNDCDELIYLLPEDNSDGSKTVSTSPDKTRGAIAEITFSIAPDRSVSLTDYVDVIANAQVEQDKAIISTVQTELANGSRIQKELINVCIQAEHGKNRSAKVLEKYATSDNPLWARAKGANNAWVYSIL